MTFETILIHNRMGRQYWVEKDDKLYIQRFARENGPYQVRNLKFIRKCYPKNPIIIDVGMNVGNNTMEYATWAKKVYGFEPFIEIFNLAKQNIEINKKLKLKGRYYNLQKQKDEHNLDIEEGWWKENGKFSSLDIISDIKIFNVALGTKNQKMQIEHHPKNSGHNCILTNKRKKISKYKLYDVEVRTLDSYNFKDINVIKIDVEGYEFNVIKGGINTIKKYKPLIQIEVVEHQYKKYDYTIQNVIDFFLLEIGDYVFCDYKGTNLGTKWKKIKGVMDYFFINKKIYNKLFSNGQQSLDKFKIKKSN